MKALNFLLLGCVFFVAGAANGQTFFKDSTVWYMHEMCPSVSPPIDVFSYFHKDEVFLDSVSGNTEFYSGVRSGFYTSFQFSYDSIFFKLLVKDSVVYYTGPIWIYNDTTKFLYDFALFDAKLTSGDTFQLQLPKSTCHLKIDSVQNRRFYLTADCHLPVFYFSPYFFQSGIGFSSGILPFTPVQSCGGFNLISACSKENMLYSDSSSFYYKSYNFSHYCSEDSLKSLAVKISASSVKEPLKIKASIYPNPASEKLHIQLTEPKGTYQVQISDATGKKFTNRSIISGEEVIDISALPKGIYLVLVTDEKGSFYSQKVVKM